MSLTLDGLLDDVNDGHLELSMIDNQYYFTFITYF